MRKIGQPVIINGKTVNLNYTINIFQKNIKNVENN